MTQDGSAAGRATDDKVKNILTIFDLQNKFIAYTAPVKTVTALVFVFPFYTEHSSMLSDRSQSDVKMAPQVEEAGFPYFKLI